MNQVTPFKNRPQRSIVDDALSGLANRPNTISRHGSRFTLVDTAGNSQALTWITDQRSKFPGEFYIDVVIVDANRNKSRMFYGLEPYQDGEVRPPKCWSDNGSGPSVQSIEPQAPTCASCPHSGWNNNTPPACRSFKKIAVIVVDDPQELVYEFTIPPGSWSGERGWSKYVATLKQHDMDVVDVITRISFILGVNHTLAFTHRPEEPSVANHPDLIARCDAVWESGVTPTICGMLDVARDPALPLDKPAATNGAVQQQLPPPRPATSTEQAIQKRGRGRPPKDPNAQPKSPVSGNGPEALDVPPFLRKPPTAISAPQAPTEADFNRQHGLQTPSEPPEDVKDALFAAFNLKTE